MIFKKDSKPKWERILILKTSSRKFLEDSGGLLHATRPARVSDSPAGSASN